MISFKDSLGNLINVGTIIRNSDQEYVVKQYNNKESPYHMMLWVYNLNNEKDNQLLTHYFASNSRVNVV